MENREVQRGAGAATAREGWGGVRAFACTGLYAVRRHRRPGAMHSLSTYRSAAYSTHTKAHTYFFYVQLCRAPSSLSLHKNFEMETFNAEEDWNADVHAIQTRILYHCTDCRQRRVLHDKERSLRRKWSFWVLKPFSSALQPALRLSTRTYNSL